MRNPIIFVGLFLGLGCSPILGQGSLWSPPDKSFTIQVPQNLKADDSYGEESEPNAVKTFVATWKKKAFLVMILKYSNYCATSTKEKFDGLFFVIGGDDDDDLTETAIKVEGLPARQVLYNKRPNKGVFIDAGDTVYVLGFASEEKKDRNSNSVRKFFDSFKLTRTAKASSHSACSSLKKLPSKI